MQAIQIKYLPCTNTKPVRLKAWSAANTQLTVSRNSSKDITIEDECRMVAEGLIREMIERKCWHEDTKITGFGCLPNGDYVATIGK